MSLKSVLLFAGAALGHGLLSTRAPGRFGCAAPEPTEEDLAIAQQFAVEEAAALESGGFTAQAAIAVDVWLHAVAATSGGLSSVSHLFPAICYELLN